MVSKISLGENFFSHLSFREGTSSSNIGDLENFKETAKGGIEYFADLIKGQLSGIRIYPGGKESAETLFVGEPHLLCLPCLVC